jgi:hypothetical protein
VENPKSTTRKADDTLIIEPSAHKAERKIRAAV